ncbi:ABC transporter permease [Bacillaceae bacterium SIJ1]|uniref:ABC transporter permease n=1 Tax=Litoribacterium kuwaitense TaxID=1398745 RepID=UPI0013EDF2F8|nr:ABC transporter permease [Litoribacterium kuwaitense]NGP46691.1 ABC transporter permease [Litoribacterium kuwaitense]
MSMDVEGVEAPKTKKFQTKDFVKKYNLFFILIGFFIIGSLLSEHFLTTQNVLNVLQQSSFVGIVAIGMTFVILVAGIDLSVGAVLALSGMLVSLLLSQGMNPILAIIITIMAGALMGFVSGFLSTKFKVPAFIATLAMMVSARGFALLTTDGEPIYDLPPMFTALGESVGRIPVPVIIWVILTIISAIALKYTTFGRKLYAVGGNEESARLSGISVEKYITSTYLLSGVLAAIAGILMSAWLTVGQPTAGQGLELDAIAAVVIGGTSLAGGKGGIGGTFIGVLIMSIIVNIFNLLGLSSYYQSIFMGAIIVIALIMNQYLANKK